MKTFKASLFLFLILLNFPVIGATAPITFSYDYGSADILVGGTLYDNVSLRIVATADTSGIYTVPPALAIHYNSLEFTVGGG